jgi:hypothetical protein
MTPNIAALDFIASALEPTGEISICLILTSALVTGISRYYGAVPYETQLINSTGKRAARNQFQFICHDESVFRSFRGVQP